MAVGGHEIGGSLADRDETRATDPDDSFGDPLTGGSAGPAGQGVQLFASRGAVPCNPQAPLRLPALRRLPGIRA